MRSLSLLLSLFALCLPAQVIYNGVPWHDEAGRPVNAHGGGLIEDGGRYWLFGEYKNDTTNAFPGFGCYSSADLEHWRFERVVLPVQPDGLLGPDRVGERVKVMRCPKTGLYVMLMHTDNLRYGDPCIAVATSATINGHYTLRGPLMHHGRPVRRWDMGVFQDTDGTGYLLIHHGPILRLAADYLSVDAQVADVKGMGESPAMFKKGGVYFLLTSNLTSWERNDNYYFTAPAVSGPWTRRGLFCPEGTLTWNSQTTSVFPLRCGADTIPMYMGDRWSYPHQASAATYVWLPMQVDGTRLSIPRYMEAWRWESGRLARANRESGRPARAIKMMHNLDNAGETPALPVLRRPGRLHVYGTTTPHGGYARIVIKDRKGRTVHTALIDFYSKVPATGLRFRSPLLPRGRYTVGVEPTGESPVWYDKARHRFGSDGAEVNVSRVEAVEE